eukprot:TRINITY_DN1533_c0_g1_i4.p1 TRINITY_DN1533_c0_g1~~TRINITY_DN1533_c0_g1_i4.p1  ORF type:complete len:137 (-),score=46.93 TRINITY_DN1533_c0_g1_i4:330-740(-)
MIAASFGVPCSGETPCPPAGIAKVSKSQPDGADLVMNSLGFTLVQKLTNNDVEKIKDALSKGKAIVAKTLEIPGLYHHVLVTDVNRDGSFTVNDPIENKSVFPHAGLKEFMVWSKSSQIHTCLHSFLLFSILSLFE